MTNAPRLGATSAAPSHLLAPCRVPAVRAGPFSSRTVQAGSSHVNISGESAPLSQLGAASEAVHVAKRDNAHVPLGGMALMPGPKTLWQRPRCHPEERKEALA
jgi:hypothetical protein